MLRVERVDTFYGRSQILHGVSLTVRERELICVLGANGAGKSTLLKTIVGLVPFRGGSVEFSGRPIGRMPPHLIVREGITLCPEDKKIFPQMSVLKNLNLGAWVHGGDAAKIEKNMGEIFGLFPILRERRNQMAGTLSGGEQQMLVIGRSLMSNPKLLMLDEPSLGIAPLVVERIFEVIREINRRGTTILLVEQNASISLTTAARGYIMETGRITLEGPSETLLRDEKVKKAYLGL
ncbi:MAG TPA: ABC transporter ATP-binding protein [Thermodesulfobacteriota bacterium]|nr:ABC transporter ATP-binding protein [Thermodesulfobacteriota bacterium]